MPLDSTPRSAAFFICIPPGNVAPTVASGRLEASARIRCAADDLQRLTAADRHPADTQLVRVRVLLAGDDFADDDAVECGADRFDPFDLEAGHRQSVAEPVTVRLDRDKFAQPVFGKFHRCFFTRAFFLLVIPAHAGIQCLSSLG